MDRLIQVFDESGTKIEPDPHIFFLDWENRRVEWLSKIPSDQDLKFKARIVPKKKQYIFLCSNFQTTTSYHQHLSEINTQIEERVFINILKSQMQKSIRRSDIYRGLKSAYSLFMLNPQVFFRRLLICVLEDVHPIHEISIFIWLAIAYEHGYQISIEQFCWCLGLMHFACEAEHLDNRYKTVRMKSDDEVKIYKLDQMQKNLIISLQIASKLLGYKPGDRDIIQKIIWVYYQDFLKATKSDKIVLDIPIPFVTPPITPMHIDELSLSAFDFHFDYKVCNMVAQRAPQFREGDIKTAIWLYNSSLTNKRQVVEIDFDSKGQYLEIWKKISSHFHSVAKYLHRKLTPSSVAPGDESTLPE